MAEYSIANQTAQLPNLSDVVVGGAENKSSRPKSTNPTARARPKSTNLIARARAGVKKEVIVTNCGVCNTECDPIPENIVNNQYLCLMCKRAYDCQIQIEQQTANEKQRAIQ